MLTQIRAAIWAAPALIAVIAIAAAVYYRGDRDAALLRKEEAERAKQAAQEQVGELLEVNAQAERNINRMLELQAEDSRRIAEMMRQQQTITESFEETRRAIAELEESDPSVRDWLRTPIPDQLRTTGSR